MAYFFGLFLVYLVGSWLPLMIRESGFTLTQAAVIAAMFQLGGPLGAISMGWLMGRYNPDFTLITTYLIGTVFLVVITYVAGYYGLFIGVAFIVGYCFNGANAALNALSSTFFPISARATGNSWMHGIGRIGAIISAYAGAWMLNLNWGIVQVFWALTIPAILIVLCLVLKVIYYTKVNTHSATSAIAK